MHPGSDPNLGVRARIFLVPTFGALTPNFSVLERQALLELRLRELLQRADRVRHLRPVRRRELDHLLALAVDTLLHADVAAVRDENVDVRLPLDAHTRDLLAGNARSRLQPRRRSRRLPVGLAR